MLRPLALLVCVALPGGIAAGEPVPVAPPAKKADAELARLKADLRAIIEKQGRIRDEVERQRSESYPARGYGAEAAFPDPILGEVPTLVLKKGQRITVSQTIRWNRYAEDGLLVWFRPSDASLVVPEKLELNFERHRFRFGYDVTVGDKVGEFTVTLTPTPGKSIEVKVIVK
jgi:hypothetical protein